MRQGICRALVVLALLVPLSRYSFGDPFGATGTLQASGDSEGGSLTFPSFTFSGNSGATWALFGNNWAAGSSVQPSYGISYSDGGGWTLNGVSGDYSTGSFNIDATNPFTVEAEGPYAGVPGAELLATGVPITWTGQIDLFSDNGTLAYAIDLTGEGTASFAGYETPWGYSVAYGTADVSDAATITPEPSTLTLTGIAGIVLIVGIRFRQHFKRKKAPAPAGSALA